MKWPWKNRKALSPYEGYEQWASSYHAEDNPVRNLSNETISSFLPDVSAKTVLDAGCGTGYFCQLVEKCGAGRIIGIDLSPAMIAVAKKNCPKAELHCEELSACSIPGNSVDLVICALVLGHLEAYEPALHKITNSLKKNGSILLSDFHPNLTMQKEKRTFRNGKGETHEIQHHLHPLPDILDFLREEGMVIDDLKEPRWNNVSVIYGIKATRV